MDRESVVLDVEVQHEGSTHHASYFVEGETIYASVGGRILVAPLTGRPAADTVRSLLAGHLLQQSRKIKHVTRWQAVHTEKPVRH